MSLNYFLNINEAHPWMNINCNAIKVNGSLIIPVLPVKQETSPYTISSGNTITESTNIYYTSDENSVTMGGRLNYTYNAAVPQKGISIVFTIPPEFHANFQTNVTPVFSGYLVQKFPDYDSACNGMANQCLLSGTGSVLLSFVQNITIGVVQSFTVVFKVSLVKNL
jgi:hypothetical protein